MRARPHVNQYATDFYQAITTITSGLMLPLTTADLLAHAIVGSVLENLDMERLVREVGHAVAQRILGYNESVDDVAKELHEKLLLRNESTKKVVIESIYRDSEEARHNVSVFLQAPSLAEARPLLKRVSCNYNDRRNSTQFFCRFMVHALQINIFKLGSHSLAAPIRHTVYRRARHQSKRRHRLRKQFPIHRQGK